MRTLTCIWNGSTVYTSTHCQLPSQISGTKHGGRLIAKEGSEFLEIKDMTLILSTKTTIPYRMPQ